MIGEHRLGPELGYKPVTYTCVCGHRDTDYGNVSRHIADENARLHEPRRLTTVRAIGPGATEISVASTPFGDQEDAVEVLMLVRTGREGRYQQHRALVHRSSLGFLIDELEAHRLGKDLGACSACAAQAFAARITAEGRRIEHSCSKREPEVP